MTLDQLPLQRPLVFFDLETTGLNVVTDRIIQLAAMRFEPGGGEPTRLMRFVNPGMPIPAASSAIHGINDERVAHEPSFEDILREVDDFFADADVAGYNISRFDLPLLMEEFARAGKHFDMQDRRKVDVQDLFFRMEPRTLAGAVRFYCGEEMTDAHDAMADTEASVRVLARQLERYGAEGKLVAEVDHLHKLAERPGQLDSTNRLKLDDAGEVVFNFGKYQGQQVRSIFAKEPSYYRWIQERDFGVEVKQITREVWESMRQPRGQ